MAAFSRKAQVARRILKADEGTLVGVEEGHVVARRFRR